MTNHLFTINELVGEIFIHLRPIDLINLKSVNNIFYHNSIRILNNKIKNSKIFNFPTNVNYDGRECIEMIKLIDNKQYIIYGSGITKFLYDIHETIDLFELNILPIHNLQNYKEIFDVLYFKLKFKSVMNVNDDSKFIFIKDHSNNNHTLIKKYTYENKCGNIQANFKTLTCYYDESLYIIDKYSYPLVYYNSSSNINLYKIIMRT